MDITHQDGVTRRSWDLANPSQAEEAFNVVKRDKPQLVMLSPPCTKFCNLWNLMKKDVPRDEWLHAVRMVNVAVRIAEIQLDAGRHFVFEHPLTARSWKLPSLRRLRSRAGVCEAVAHMCQFGLESSDKEGMGLAKKPTRLLTSSTAIRDMLSRRCPGDHRHVQLVSGRAGPAQQYTIEFCDAILEGLKLELISRCANALALLPARELLHRSGVALEPVDDDGHIDPEKIVREFGNAVVFQGVEGKYVDDITGQPLETELVQAGRHEELKGFDRRGVYEVRPRSWAERFGFPILGTRWVDKRKGDAVRSRLCVQDFNFRKGKLGPDDLFAPTPPTIAARYTVSRAASGPRFPRRMRRSCMVLDFEKAFLNGSMERDVCIELPPEDARRQGGRNVGYLRRAMYGLREAPAIWQSVVQALMKDLGFRSCTTVPCVYHHSERDLLVVAHVDDFLVSGPRHELLALKNEIRRRYDCDGDVLGDEEGDVSEISFLGRRLVLTKDGIEWQGDRKLVDAFLKRAGVDASCSTTRVGQVDTPGVKRERDTEAPPMNGAEATMHRSLVALLNYIAQDRPDLSFCAKDLSQTMSRPRCGDEVPLKRVVRYLARFPTGKIVFRWQPQCLNLSVFTDADWGGCAQTRRSTSGGFVLHGDHLLGFWARTQQCVALSSCEAEVNALIKGGTEGLGVKIMAQQCGHEPQLTILTDASAAQGLCARQGAGKVKHLSVRQMWAQEKESQGDFQIKKIPREMNVADMMTHHYSKAEGEKFLARVCFERMESTGASIRGGVSGYAGESQ